MGTHACPTCGKQVPDERFEVVGDLRCIECTPQRPRAKGVMVYDHKTAGVLEICNDEQFQAIKSHNDPSKDEGMEDFKP